MTKYHRRPVYIESGGWVLSSGSVSSVDPYTPILPKFFNAISNFVALFHALLIRRTVLHDLSVLTLRRTIQINSRPTEIISGSKVAICVDDEFDYYDFNYVRELRLGLAVGIKFRSLGFDRRITQVAMIVLRISYIYRLWLYGSICLSWFLFENFCVWLGTPKYLIIRRKNRRRAKRLAVNVATVYFVQVWWVLL